MYLATCICQETNHACNVKSHYDCHSYNILSELSFVNSVKWFVYDAITHNQ